MTVAELITQLQKLPPDAKVFIWENEDRGGEWFEIASVVLNRPLEVHLDTTYDEF